MNEKGECVKVMKREYVEAFKLRGNQPNILLRYIELQFWYIFELPFSYILVFFKD